MKAPASPTQQRWLDAAAEAADRPGENYADIPPGTATPLAVRGLVEIITEDGGCIITDEGREAARTGLIPDTRTVGGITWARWGERTWKVYTAFSVYTLVTTKNIQGPRRTKTWILSHDGPDSIASCDFTGSPDEAMAKAASVIFNHTRRNRDPLYCRKEGWAPA